jgi:hypothetical protein
VFTARYALSPYIKQTHFVFKGLMYYPMTTGCKKLLVTFGAPGDDDLMYYHMTTGCKKLLVTFPAPDDGGLTSETCRGDMITNVYLQTCVHLLV